MTAPSTKKSPTLHIQLLLLLITILSFNICLYAADKRKKPLYFSMVYKNQPLKDVLNFASYTTGYQIFINKEYAITPVSGAFYNASIHDGLKIIISRMNHTITYEKGNRISIIIYKKVPPDPSTVEFVPAYLGPREPVQEISANTPPDEIDLDKIATLAENLPPSTLRKIIEKIENTPLNSEPETVNKAETAPPDSNASENNTIAETVE